MTLHVGPDWDRINRLHESVGDQQTFDGVFGFEDPELIAKDIEQRVVPGLGALGIGEEMLVVSVPVEQDLQPHFDQLSLYYDITNMEDGTIRMTTGEPGWESIYEARISDVPGQAYKDLTAKRVSLEEIQE